MRCKIIEITFFSLIVIHVLGLFLNIDALCHISLLTVGLLSIYAYLKVTKFKKEYAENYSFNPLFLVLFCLLYICDILYAFTPEHIINYPKFYVNILCYIILIFIVISQIVERGLQKTDLVIKGSLLITLFLFSYIFYYLNEMIKTTNMEFYKLFIFYGFILLILSFSVVINFTQKANRSNINLVIASVCIILNDVFYIINLTYIKIPLFIIIISISNLLTYYFLFHYEMNRNKIYRIK